MEWCSHHSIPKGHHFDALFLCAKSKLCHSTTPNRRSMGLRHIRSGRQIASLYSCVWTEKPTTLRGTL